MQHVLYADNRVVDIIEDIGLDDYAYCYSLRDAMIQGLPNFSSDSSDILKETVKCNCPNCGAPVKSHTCEYCGTILDPIAAKNEKYNLEWSLQREQSELLFLESRMRVLQAQISQEEQSRSIISHLSNICMKG